MVVRALKRERTRRYGYRVVCPADVTRLVRDSGVQRSSTGSAGRGRRRNTAHDRRRYPRSILRRGERRRDNGTAAAAVAVAGESERQRDRQTDAEPFAPSSTTERHLGSACGKSNRSLWRVQLCQIREVI